MNASPRSKDIEPWLEELKRKVIAATGMVYFADKDDALISAIHRAFKVSSDGDVTPYFKKIYQNIDQAFDKLVDELTIGETFFFRHTEMFEAMRATILPQILKKNKQHKLLRIWSAGCSIGAEPYSLSILLNELLGKDVDQWKIEIVGTDINRKFLRTAVRGLFAPWALRGLSEEVRNKYFEPKEALFELRAQYRKGVHFRYYNLITDFERIPQDFYGIDLLICRNVMIYFDSATNERLVQAFHQCLHDEGWLLVGHAENHTPFYRSFKTVNARGAVLYQKSTKAAEPSAVPSCEFRMWSFETKGPLHAIPVPQPPVSKVSLVRKVSLPVPVAKEPQKTPPSSDAITMEILQLCDSGYFDQALYFCETQIGKQPTSSPLYYLRGLIHAHLGQWDHAKEDFKKRLFYYRHCVMTHYQLALLPQERSNAQKHLRNADKSLSTLQGDDIIPLSGGITCSAMQSVLRDLSQQS